MPEDTELEFTVPEGSAPERADKVLARLHTDFSRSQWQKIFAQGKVWLEDEAIIKKHILHPGDTISFTLPQPEVISLEPVNIPLGVIYEDEDIVVVSKPVGMVVHPGAGTGPNTLVHALLHHTGGKLAAAAGVVRPGIVHRLDKETSGVIVAAKTDKAYHALSRAFSQRKVRKEYSVLVSGSPELDSGIIEVPIGRHAVRRTKMTVREDGLPARSDWRVEKRFEKKMALLNVRIHTGRTHQIRVHLAHLGFPVLGDAFYGDKRGAPRVMLHARYLELAHPVSGELLELEAPLPEDFRELMGGA